MFMEMESAVCWCFASKMRCGFFPGRRKVVVGSEKLVGNKMPKPARGGDDKFIALLLVHCLDNFIKILVDRWIVTSLPVLERIIAGDFGIHGAGASASHDAIIIANEVLVDAETEDELCRGVNIRVRARVIAAQVAKQK